MNKNELELTVRFITSAMKTDYPLQYMKAYSDVKKNNDEPSDESLMKKRMWVGIKYCDKEKCLKAYQTLCEENTTYMPTLQGIISKAKSMSAKKERLRVALAEKESLAKLPAPKHTVDPIKMLADAKQEIYGKKTNHQHAIERHNKLIAKDKRSGKINTAPRHDNAKCAVGSCFKSGGFISSLRGTESWYCLDHFRN